MNGKSLFDLTIEDLNQNPIWYFPMEESVIDGETFIAPVESEKILDMDYEIIVKTIFICNSKKEYTGYIYWGNPRLIQFLKPTIIINDLNIDFWNGIRRPDNTKQVIELLGEKAFPICYISENVMGLESIKGILDGLYYLDSLNNIVVEKI